MKKYIKICPKCGSIDTKIPSAGLDLKMAMPDMCMDCEFRGIFPEVEIEKTFAVLLYPF